VIRVRRPSAQTAAVLHALADDPDRWRYGYDLCTQLGLKAGSMYPILIRLAERELLETSWEAERVPGRPARHLYRLSEAGREYAAAVAEAGAAEAAAAARAPGRVPGATARRPPQPRWEGA
jgi:PadR family transcriptional regulator, regulatory protein PadR